LQPESINAKKTIAMFQVRKRRSQWLRGWLGCVSCFYILWRKNKA